MLRLCAVWCVLFGLIAGPAVADPLLPLIGGELVRQAGLSGGTDRQVREAIYRQRAELTCGPAALASLLTFYCGDPCTEDEIAKLAGSYEQLGTSLLGLRNACRVRGHVAAGYRMDMAQLRATLDDLGIPVLVHYREPIEHFVLVVAVRGDHVLVSDPAGGSVDLAREDFTRRFSGAVLVVSPGPRADRARVVRRIALFERRLATLREVNRALRP